MTLAALDTRWGSRSIVIATVLLAPFVVALLGSPRQTAAVAVAAVVACAVSGSWNDNYGSEDYLLRLVVVIAGGAFAVLGARSRRRLARDQQRFELLRAAAEISDSTASIDDTVERLGDLIVPDLADVCVIDVIRDHEVERLTVVAHGPRAAEVEEGLRARALDAPRESEIAATSAMRSGRAVLIARSGQSDLRAAAHDESDLEFLRSLEGRSTMIVPLRARGRSIGAMALVVTSASGRLYHEGDLEFAKVLSGRVALALDNAGLFSELASLEAQHGAALGSLAEAVTMQNAEGELVYANQAAARALGFGSVEELLATPGLEIAARWESYNEDGTPLRFEDLPGRQALAGKQPQPLLVRAVNRATGEERWRLTKATAVLDRHGRPELAVNVIEDVTDVKRAELAQRFLAEAGALLSSSMDYEETLAQVARLAVPELADWCGVSIPDERGFLRPVAVAHVDPERVRFAQEYQRTYRVRVTDETGSAQVLRDGISQVVNEIPDELLEQAVSDPEQLAAVRELGMRAAMLVPMTTATGVSGVISFVSAESRRTFTQADVELAEELGRRAGTAVENARLYSERSHIARTLQAGLLPDELPDVPGFGLAALYRPAGEENLVGGDFYDAFPTTRGWMVVVGDVTGRGPEAAALTSQARHTLRTAGALLGDPVATVAELNRSLTAKPVVSICTAAVMVLQESEDGSATATIACAGHPLPILIRHGTTRPVGGTGPVLGAWADSSWRTETVALNPGDVLLFYTDGVTDARGAEGRFGDERLAAAVRSATGAAEAVAAVSSALEAFEDEEKADDTAVVAVHRSPDGTADGGALLRGDPEAVS